MIYKPKVSVIIPVYNVEKYVEECLDSVCNQTLKEIEIICINDKSTDESWDIVQKKATSDERFRLLENEKNQGLSYTRNRGLKEAAGKYVYMLDSDDMIELNALEQLWLEAEKEKLDMVLFDATLNFEQEEARTRYKTYLGERKGIYEGVKSGTQIFEEMQQHGDWTSSVPRFFYKREFLEKNNMWFYEGILHEDEYFSFQAILLTERAIFMNDKFFIRRFRENSIMTSEITDRHFYGYFVAYYMMNKFSFEIGYRTKEALRCLAIIREKLQNYYQKLNGVYKLEECFPDGEIKNAYYIFADMQNEQAICGAVNQETLKQIQRYKSRYIYGAGIRAKRVFHALVRAHLDLDGFIVTDLGMENTSLLGQKIVEVNKLNINPVDTIVIVSMKADQKEICNELKKIGIETVVYEQLLEF